jgi:hypothetical protein
MPDVPTVYVAEFRESFKHLTEFWRDWTEEIDQQARQDNQRKASYYIWARWSLLIRTFHRICDPGYIPDIYLVARSCFECEASLKAIKENPTLADQYLAFPDKAKAYYAWVCKKLGLEERLAKLEPELKQRFGDNWEREKATQWCSNISEMIETYCDPAKRLLYASCSHFVHGTAVVAHYLENSSPTENDLNKAIEAIYTGYLVSTYEFLKIVWGPIVQEKSTQCQNAFSGILASWVNGVTS